MGRLTDWNLLCRACPVGKPDSPPLPKPELVLGLGKLIPQSSLKAESQPSPCPESELHKDPYTGLSSAHAYVCGLQSWPEAILRPLINYLSAWCLPQEQAERRRLKETACEQPTRQLLCSPPPPVSLLCLFYFFAFTYSVYESRLSCWRHGIHARTTQSWRKSCHLQQQRCNRRLLLAEWRRRQNVSVTSWFSRLAQATLIKKLSAIFTDWRCPQWKSEWEDWDEQIRKLLPMNADEHQALLWHREGMNIARINHNGKYTSWSITESGPSLWTQIVKSRLAQCRSQFIPGVEDSTGGKAATTSHFCLESQRTSLCEL